MTRERFLTIRWNNYLSLALGVPGLAYVILALFVLSLSDFAAFIGMVIVGAFF